MSPLPPQRLARAQGAGAGDWLAGLPALVEKLLGRWELTAERVVAPGGRSSVLVLVREADGGRAALKICAPDAPAALEEAALRHWDGLGAVRLLRSAPEDGALLLERLHCETSLRSLPDAKAMLEAVSTARRLWVEPGPGHPFPSVEARTGRQAELMRAAGAGEETGPLVAEALRTRAELVADAGERLLLHGDFRQGSVLASDAERAPWLAVGPEPVVGERAYDLARLVRDRLHDLVASPGAAAITRRRVTRLAESVEVDPERVRGWALFRAVESGVRHLAAGQRTDGEMLLEFATWL
ncbi:aminoglycoside phosphotransferase family protein [Streptomyces sp. DSM 44938]|uniref:Aminoglycoside phosphotransferase family protein n=1 Tax=Streptomyces litchfieldiae TaxID=3075543 RepID=A0ABU2MHL7_9ACTN|nr:aminoglycoside phosphotransferase family protein [Streptomyces sp. DSM 44938]MDT0341076.1 aminoglycoside phosphotransferase family protein [Streptomyces sp. DSM 44938]